MSPGMFFVECMLLNSCYLGHDLPTCEREKTELSKNVYLCWVINRNKRYRAGIQNYKNVDGGMEIPSK